MEIISENSEEYQFVLFNEDKNKIKDSIDKLIDSGRTVSSDVLHVCRRIFGDNDFGSNKKIFYSKYTFDTIKQLLQ